MGIGSFGIGMSGTGAVIGMGGIRRNYSGRGGYRRDEEPKDNEPEKDPNEMPEWVNVLIAIAIAIAFGLLIYITTK